MVKAYFMIITNQRIKLDSHLLNKYNNSGVTSANHAIELAKSDNDESISIIPLPISLAAPPIKSSKSKLARIHAIHLIRFCIKTGISENRNIIKFLEENKIVLTGRTFDRYKSIADKELQNDLEADIWLAEKTQNALVKDYKDISDRYDRQLVLDDLLMDGLIKQAVDKATKFENQPDKYYQYIDTNEMMKIQAMSNYTMKNKLEFISKGFMVYRIKQYIDYLHNKQEQKQNPSDRRDKEIKFKSSTTTSKLDSSIQNHNQIQEEEFDQEYLDRYDLVIGMNGKPIKKYLAEFEKKLGKPLSTL